MNENTFKSGMAMMSKLFGKTLEDEIIPAYWNILKQLSDNDFLKIQGNLIKTFIPTSQVPFPLPAHFLNAGGLSGQNRSKAAIAAILAASNPYRSVSFGDLALHATIERLGGWPTVASWTLDDWQFKEKSFLSAYESAIASGEDGPLKLMGIYEFENADKKFEGKQLAFAEKMKEPALIEWVGFDKNIANRIENKSQKNKLFENVGIDIKQLTENIGKEIK
jgi:hypothetical protein